MMNGFADRNRFATPRAFDGTEPGFLVRHDSSPRSIATSVNQIAVARAEWHGAPSANQFVSLYAQRIHRRLHPRQQLRRQCRNVEARIPLSAAYEFAGAAFRSRRR